MMGSALDVLTPTATPAKTRQGSVQYVMKDTINHRLDQLSACHVLLWAVRYVLLLRVAALVWKVIV